MRAAGGAGPLTVNAESQASARRAKYLAWRRGAPFTDDQVADALTRYAQSISDQAAQSYWLHRAERARAGDATMRDFSITVDYLP